MRAEFWEILEKKLIEAIHKSKKITNIRKKNCPFFLGTVFPMAPPLIIKLSPTPSKMTTCKRVPTKKNEHTCIQFQSTPSRTPMNLPNKNEKLRSRWAASNKPGKKKSKLIHNTEEDVCRVTPGQAETTVTQCRKIKYLKFLNRNEWKRCGWPQKLSQSEKNINSSKIGTRITESVGMLQEANYAFFTFPSFGFLLWR